MSYNEFATYASDIQKANKMYDEQTGVDLSRIFREIYRRKFDADMYGEPYVSVFA